MSLNSVYNWTHFKHPNFVDKLLVAMETMLDTGMTQFVPKRDGTHWMRVDAAQGANGRWEFTFRALNVQRGAPFIGGSQDVQDCIGDAMWSWVPAQIEYFTRLQARIWKLKDHPYSEAIQRDMLKDINDAHRKRMQGVKDQERNDLLAIKKAGATHVAKSGQGLGSIYLRKEKSRWLGLNVWYVVAYTDRKVLPKVTKLDGPTKHLLGSPEEIVWCPSLEVLHG